MGLQAKPTPHHHRATLTPPVTAPCSRPCHYPALLEIRVRHPRRDPETPSPQTWFYLHSVSLSCLPQIPGPSPPSILTPSPARSPSSRASSAGAALPPKAPNLSPGFQVSRASIRPAGGCQRPPPESSMIFPKQDIRGPGGSSRHQARASGLAASCSAGPESLGLPPTAAPSSPASLPPVSPSIHARAACWLPLRPCPWECAGQLRRRGVVSEELKSPVVGRVSQGMWLERG